MQEKHTLEQRSIWASIFAENMMINYATYLFCCDFVATRRVTHADYERLRNLSLEE